MLETFVAAQEKLFSLQQKVSLKLVRRVVKLPGNYYLMFSIRMKIFQLICERPHINATQINTREITNKNTLYLLQYSMQQLQLLLGVTLKTLDMHLTFKN